MQPQNNPSQNNQPSGPPPNELPRPQMRMSDVRPAQPVQPPRAPHPGDHLLEAPHEPLIDSGIEPSAAPPPEKQKRSKAKSILWVLLGLFVVAIIAIVGAVVWYQQQLTPVSPGTDRHVRLVIEPGSSPSMIADSLKEANLIKSAFAFSIYTKLSSTQNSLKAGTYNLKPSESTQQIVDHLLAGKQDTFSLTFLPGDTLANNRKKIIGAGYSTAEVDAALAKTYDRPLFAGKPATADLEGYIYGETYEFSSTASVESILNRTFDEYEKFITTNDLVNGFKKQGFSLYQGITLASIIQREVTGGEDERQVARVFLNRLEVGMGLGSDVTYQYAAKKMGVAPTPLLESPYNTRIKKGLPPGPISVPGAGALKAVANPGTNDYLFFLSGDDDVTYFAKTDAEHQSNIANHCKEKCLIN